MMIRLFLLLVLLFLFLFSCTAPEKPKGEEATPGAPQPIAKEAWQIKWDNWLEAAKKEGRLTIYTGTPRVAFDALSRKFTEKYGIALEIVVGKSSELAQKVNAERRAGLHIPDFYMSGPPLFTFKPDNLLTPLDPILLLPEVLDPKVWWKGELDWIDKEHLILAHLAFPSHPFYLNTRYIRPENIKSYRDLLDPKWKGKFVMNDPWGGGPGVHWFSLVGAKIMGMDFVREFAKQEPIILRNERLQAEWLAQGKYHIGISVSPSVVAEFINAGTPLMGHTPVEGGAVTSAGAGQFCIFKDAPHPNAARIFANWFLSKEGQTIFSKAIGLQSGRLDVPTDHLDPASLGIPGMKYYDITSEKYVSEIGKYFELAKEIYGHLLR